MNGVQGCDFHTGIKKLMFPKLLRSRRRLEAHHKRNYDLYELRRAEARMKNRIVEPTTPES